MSAHEKIVRLEDLPGLLEPLRTSGKKIVHSHGSFDLLHPGHALHFESAKQQGDILVVTMTSDQYINKGPGRPVYPQAMRAAFLASLGCVDFVAVNNAPHGVTAIQAVRPHVYVKGGQYLQAEEAGDHVLQLERETVESFGGRMFFTPIFTNEGVKISSSSLLNRHFDIYPEESQFFLQEFRTRYTGADVMKAIESIRGLKVLVIGDAVIDEYRYVRPMGKTSKSNIIATRFLNEEAFIGGVFACANHLAGFCDRVDVVSSLGLLDSREGFIRKNLKPNVTPTFFYRNDATTTIKRRYLDSTFLSKLFEVYYFEDKPLPQDVDAALRAHLESVLPQYDVVISLDYAHGLLSSETIELLSKKSRFLAVNTQTNAANIGYNPVIKYPHADFVCIDEPELRLATRDRFGAVEPLLEKIVHQMGASRGIVTRGHKGCLVMDEAGSLTSVPVFSQKVVDAVGAGDAFLAITAPCVAMGLPMDLVGFIGNAVGAQAVLIVGNRESVEPIALSKAIKAIMA